MKNKDEIEFKQESINNCPVCLSSEIRFHLSKFDDRYGQADIFHLYRCLECDAVFLKNRIKEAEHPPLYEKYYIFLSKINKKTSTKEAFFWLQKMIMKVAGEFFLIGKMNYEAKVLEIGPGDVSQLSMHSIKKNKLKWIGLEVNEKCAKNIKGKGLDVYRESFGDFISRGMKFDSIILSMSIEHLHDPILFFGNCKKVLHEDGVIFLTTANLDSRYREKYNKRWINWHVPYHQVLFSKKSIKMICENNGFYIKKYHTSTPTSWFLLQKKFSIPTRGKINTDCAMSFSFVDYLLFSVFLRFYEFFSRNSGDCMYCEIKLRK